MMPLDHPARREAVEALLTVAHLRLKARGRGTVPGRVSDAASRQHRVGSIPGEGHRYRMKYVAHGDPFRVVRVVDKKRGGVYLALVADTDGSSYDGILIEEP